MSNLKHLNKEQLIQERTACLKYIRHLNNKRNYADRMIGGQETRLKWIEKYLERCN